MVLIAVLAGFGAACGSSSNRASTTSTVATTIPSGAPTTAPSTGSGGTTPALVDIETCDNNGGTGSASGTVENDGSSPSAYRLQLGVYDSATNKLLATGSVDIATVAPGSTGDWEINTSGLGSADVVCHTISIDPGGSGSSTSGTPNTTSGSAAAEFPCTLVTQADIEQFAGNPLDAGDAATNHVSEDTANWTEHACSWAKPDASNPTEVTLAVARAADFPSGSVHCPRPVGSSTPVTGLGTSARWSFDASGGAINVGNLRVCTSTLLVDVNVTGPGSNAAQLKVARDVAGKALAAS